MAKVWCRPPRSHGMTAIPLPARLALILALAALYQPPALALDLHVATNGNDAGSGRSDEPQNSRT